MTRGETPGRRLSAGALAVTLPVAVALAATACTDPPPTERALRGLPAFCQEVLPQVDAHLAGLEQPSGERYGGTAVVGWMGELVDGMNALVSADHGAAQHQAFVNLMTLIQFDEALEPRPYLAREWELSDDQTQLTFHLRDDVRWHDGEPTTAHDVAFTYLRATDPETGFPNAAFWERYVPGEAGVEVLDDQTVRFHLEPHAEPLDPWRALAIMPRHLLGDVPPAELGDHPFGTRCPVGNGPFVFREHRPDASWSFVRNPDFPEALGGPPHLDRYVYRIVPEEATLLTELLTEGVDVVPTPSPDQAGRIAEADHLELLAFPFRSYLFVGWNQRRPQLADARVRRALTLATNRRQMLDAVLQGYGTVANAGVPPFHWAYHRGIEDALSYDPERARALLDEAGWVDRNGDGVRQSADGTPLEVTLTYNTGSRPRRDVAEIMQAQLGEVGVGVRIQALEWATLVDRVTDPGQRDFDGVVMSWVTEFKVDDRDLFHSTSADEPYGWAGTRSAELDVLLDTLPLMVDRDEALPHWHRYQELLVREQPFTFLFFPQRLVGVNHRIHGVRMDARGEWVSVADWWIPAELRRGR